MKTAPFNIGDRVVAIAKHRAFKTGDEFTVFGLRKICCTWEVEVGIASSTGYDHCTLCDRISRSKDGKWWFRADRFAPINRRKREVSICSDLKQFTEVKETIESPKTPANVTE